MGRMHTLTKYEREEFYRIYTHEYIVSLETERLWEIVRSTNAMTERFANALVWAKAELRRRGFAVV